MADQQNGVSDTTSFMDVFSSDLGTSTNDATFSGLDVTTLSDNHVVENVDAKVDSCPTEEKIADVDCIGEPSKSDDNIPQQTSGVVLPSGLLPDPSTSTEPLDECLGDNIGEEAIDVDDNDEETKESTSRKSIEALSLVDIKASFVNDEEIINCDADKNNTNVSCPLQDLNVSDLDTQTQQTIGDENGSRDVKESVNVSGQDRPNTVPDDSISANGESDHLKRTESTSDNEKVSISIPIVPCGVASNYAIQPGELTNQLIEGPSITLPSLESPVFSPSSPDVTCDPNLGNHNLNVQTSASDSSRNDERSTSESGEISTDVEPTNQFSNGTCSAPEATSSTTVSTSTATTPVISATTDTPEVSTPYSPTPAPAKKVKKTPHDFIFGKVLGEGAYSTVYLAKEVSTQREFAVKVCEKKHLIREHKTHFVMREKEVLMKLDHPFFIRLAYTFQDPERLYYVLTYARNGEILTHLNKLSVFDVPCTRFYTAEIVIALEYLQSLGIVHRDLKPENILLGDDMHIKITDFGTSKILNGAVVEEDSPGKQPRRKNSFVGTAEYVSPEILNGLPANYGTDLWALACIIYQCLSSSLPFRSGNEYQTFQKIIKLEYDFPEGFHEEAKDLVQKLLVIEPTERLGMKQPGGMETLKQHPFFQGIDWDNLPTTTPPKLLPYLPASANNPEFWGGQEHRTGFDDQRLAEIITGQSSERSQSPELEPISVRGKNEMLESVWKENIEKQRQENQFHQFVDNNIILRQGFVDKRKGLFARKRMLLLTEGPHLYYVDAHNKVLKGEIPWSKELRTEAKNFKIFFVHTPNRTYYLESRNPDAHHWVKRIQEVWTKYYGDKDSS